MRTLGGPSRHVLFLNWRDTGNPEGGGSEVYVERIAGELVAHGHRATVLCAVYPNASAEEVTASGVRIVRRGGRRTVYLRAALAYLAGLLGAGPLSARRLGRPDLVIDVCNGMPFLSALYARCPVIALVHHVHREQWPVVLGARGARFGWWIESKLAVLVYRRSRYVTVSAATRDELAVLGVAPSRITVVHNGTPEMPMVEVARAPYPFLVTLGRLVPHKRVEVSLRAVAELSVSFPALRLVIAGQGWWEQHLRLLAEELGISERVRFAGFITDSEKHALLSAAWVALTPSLKEGWGLTIVEAGSVATPTVAFRSAGGVAEAIVDTETGLLADDDDDFIIKVKKLLTDDQLRQDMGAAAKAHAGLFTWEASGARFAQLVAAATGEVLRQPRAIERRKPRALREASPKSQPTPTKP